MTLQRLNSLLSVEGLPFTLNHMYLKEYKAKFLAHYRDIRRRSKGQDAIVHRFQELNKVVATDRPNLELMNLTGILQRFGLTCSPNDLHRLLPEDELEPALDIIATVRAYFQGKPISQVFSIRTEGVIFALAISGVQALHRLSAIGGRFGVCARF